MTYVCNVCDKTIKLKLKSRHFKSNVHKDFDRCKNKKLTTGNSNKNDTDEIICAYIIKHNRNYYFYLMKRDFKLVFNDNQCCPKVTSELYIIKKMCLWNKFFDNVSNDFKDKGYNFNNKAEMNIIAFVNKFDMSYDFSIKHNFSALERRVNAMIKKKL